jgi:GNAT superfamily N-acetyltransferase
MQCQIYLDAGEMWIASLRVAAPFRLQGLGRELVTASERIARDMGIGIIKVFPFPASEPFWRKMDYEPDPRAARVLLKDLSWQYVTHNGVRQMENTA